MNKIKIKSNAKINLTLAIKYKRPDGFNENESIFQEIYLYDELYLAKKSNISIETDSRLVPSDQNNICHKAAETMCRKYNIPGVLIELVKNIPVGAGLGGGSSNAAAVLAGLKELYKLDIKKSELIDIAAELGSDIPFFFFGGTAYVTGRGEILKPIPMNLDYSILLVFPGQPVSTVRAYKNLNLALTKNVSVNKLIGFKFQSLNTVDFRSEYYNDFENMVFEAYPDLAEIKQSLYDNGADYAAMSGSGSTIFGVYKLRDQAEKTGRLLGGKYKYKLVRPVG